MARSESMQRDDGDPPPMGHNGPSDEVVIGELAKVKAAWAERAKDKEAYQASNAVYRRTIQNAKARGLNAEAIRDVVNAFEQDPEDIAQRMKDHIWYSGLLGRPIGSQGEIFAAENLGNPGDLGRQKVQGRKQTGRRSMLKANPYPSGSWQAAEFERGWFAGARATP